MKYDVEVVCNVPAYGTVEVEARSQADAERKVAQDIERNGWESQAWQGVTMKPSWAEADDFRVDCEAL